MKDTQINTKETATASVFLCWSWSGVRNIGTKCFGNGNTKS